MTAGLVLSLCDRTGVMVQPWLEAGYRCVIVDLQHPPGEQTDGLLTRIGADISTWLPPRAEYAAAFAFPPCTHLAGSGARWMREKGLPALIQGLTLVEACSGGSADVHHQGDHGENNFPDREEKS